MIRFNRIGNKLGLAGAVGILLSVGMVANQMMSEAAVEAANKEAARAQRVIDGLLVAELDLKQIELAARSIRLAKTPDEVDKSLADIRRFKDSQARELEAALAIPQCCLSEAIASVVRDAGATQVMVARSPDEKALFEVLDRALGRTTRS